MDYGRLAPGASYHLSNHTNYGSNQRGGGTEKDGGGYAPVNPFEASVALGVKKILGKAKDRTIDQVEVQSPNRPYAAGYAGAGPAGYAQPALMERGPHFYTPYQQPQYPVPPHPYYPALNVAEGNAWHGPPGVPQYLNPRTSSPPRRRRSRSRSNRGAPFSLPQGVEIIPPRRPRSSSRAHVHYSEPSRHRSPSPALRNHYIYDRLSRSPRRAPSRDDRADRAWYRPGARSRSWGDRRSRSRSRSPRPVGVQVPPDNYIPVLDDHGQIALPPPHELRASSVGSSKFRRSPSRDYRRARAYSRSRSRSRTPPRELALPEPITTGPMSGNVVFGSPPVVIQSRPSSRGRSQSRSRSRQDSRGRTSESRPQVFYVPPVLPSQQPTTITMPARSRSTSRTRRSRRSRSRSPGGSYRQGPPTRPTMMQPPIVMQPPAMMIPPPTLMQPTVSVPQPPIRVPPIRETPDGIPPPTTIQSSFARLPTVILPPTSVIHFPAQQAPIIIPPPRRSRSRSSSRQRYSPSPSFYQESVRERSRSRSPSLELHSAAQPIEPPPLNVDEPPRDQDPIIIPSPQRTWSRSSRSPHRASPSIIQQPPMFPPVIPQRPSSRRSSESRGRRRSQCSPLYQPMGTPPILHEDSRASIPPSRRSRSPSRSRTPPIVRYRREPFQLSRRTSPPARASTPDYADRRGPRRHSPAPSWVDYGDGELWQSDRSLSPLPVPPPRHRSTMPPQYPDVPSAPSPIVLPSSNSGRRSYRQASPSITHARRPRPSHYTSHHHHGHRDADSFDEKHSYKYPEVHSSTPYRPVPQPPFINPNQKQGGAEPMSSTSDTAEVTWIAIALSLFFDLVPRQVYLHLLLRFPALYFSRVTRIFRDANLGMGEIKKMALEAVLNQDDSENGAGKHMNQMLLYNGMFLQNPQDNAPMEYVNLRNSWQGFIDSLMREWKTLNIISVLLLSAILTILQIDAAAENPLTRFSALLSLVCAFMSLLYGCIYIIRFGTMRKTHKAAEWANESERSSTSIFWNVWVMLAMPAVWLAWSMIFYIITIMSFVWQTGPTISTTNPEPPTTYLSSDLEILVPRIIISVVFGLGLVYLALIAVTFRRYSDPMEEAWRERISGWLQEKATAAARMGYAGYQSQGRPPYPGPDEHARKQQQPPYYGEKSEVKVGGEGEKGHSGRAKNLTATAPVSKSKGLTATEKGFTKLDEIPPGVKGLAPFVSFTGVNVTNLPPVTAGREVGDVDPKGGEEKRTTEKPKFKRKGNPAPLVAPSPPRDSSLPRHSPPPLIPQPAPIQPESTIISNTYPVVPGVVAIPLKSRELSDDSRSEVHNKIEEMEEVIRLDSEGARARGRLANSTENIPIPRDLLAQGLQVASWYLLCEDIKRDWDAVVQSRPGSLRDLLKSIKKWNNTLITYNMFILLVQLDSKNVNPQPNSSESPTLTTSSVVQKGCAVYLGSSELQKVGVRRDDEDELRGTAGEGGDTPYRPVWYYALVESLAEVVAVDEDDGNGLLQFSEDENDGADRGGV